MKKRYAISLAATVAAATCGTMAADPYRQPDASWISISGTVAEPTDNTFLLDYGDNVVRVEVDDWDIYAEAHPLLDGDRVTVYGRVDDGLFENTTVEAGAVFLEGLNTYIYADSSDEEGDVPSFYGYYWTSPGVSVTNDVTIRGTVTGVDPENREFRIDRGKREMIVETEDMGYNPLDEFGYQHIEKGDIVSVTGDLDFDFFGSRVLEAHSVTTLLDASDADS